MTYHDRLRRKKLADLLLDEEVASKEAVITALHEHQQTSNLLSQILLAAGELREYDLARIMVEQYQLPFIDLVNYTYHRDLIAMFPPHLLHSSRIVPLDRFGDVICFVAQELPSNDVIAQLRKYGTEHYFVYAALATEIRQALHDHVPLHDEKLVGDPAEAAKRGATGASSKMQEDGAWKELFDTANESVVSDLPAGTPETPEEVEVPVWLSDESESEGEKKSKPE